MELQQCNCNNVTVTIKQCNNVTMKQCNNETM